MTNKIIKGKVIERKAFTVNIYPVAYVQIEVDLLDYILSTFNNLLSGDGSLICNVESLQEEIAQCLEDRDILINELESLEIITTIIEEIGNKATGEIYFYTN